jgi:hypothetical protein
VAYPTLPGRSGRRVTDPRHAPAGAKQEMEKVPSSVARRPAGSAVDPSPQAGAAFISRFHIHKYSQRNHGKLENTRPYDTIHECSSFSSSIDIEHV